MNSRQTILRVLFAALLLCAPLAFSQTITTGDVTGNISDATGAVVPGAIVTLKNVDTNDARTAVTNESGQYRFSLLAPGSYTVSAATTGLKSNTAKITVSVGQEQAVNLTLNVTGTQEVVEVKAEAALIQTENANLASEISHAQIVALPMNGGDLTTVAFTTPGVRMNVGGGNGNFNANGIPLTSVLFTINGADVMDPYNNLNNSGASNNLLGSNEVAEAAVVLNAYSPSYGRMAAAQVNIVGKTGTNAFHGNAIYNYNDAIFNANSFLNNSTNTARGRSDANLYAGSIGGPIKKNKTFFFFDTEALRYALPTSAVVSIPSPQLEQYALDHAVPSAIPIYQDAIKLWNSAVGINRAIPVTNGPGPLQDPNNRLGCGTHTFGNATSGEPYVNGSSGPRFGIDVPCALAFTTNNSSVNVENLLVARADHTLTDKQKLSFRYEYDWGLQATSTSPISHVFDSKSSQPQHQGQMTYTYVINPKLVNTFTGQSSWYTAIFGVQDFAATQAAIPVRLSITDGGASGGRFAALGSGFPTGRNVGQLQLIDDLSYLRGSHTLKFGVNYRYNKVTDTSLSSGTIAGNYSLSDIADFASGIVNGSNQGSSFSQSFPLLAAAHIRVASLDLYSADEWAVRKNVKIQYGIRFEHDRNPECVDNCFSRLNVPFLQSGYQAGTNVPYNSTIQTGLSTAYHHYQSVVYEPRFGIVFTPFGNGKTVIRTGVGLFSNLPSASTVSSIFGNAPEKFTPSVTFGNVGTASDPSTSQAIAAASFATFESSFAKGFTLSQIQSALGKVPFAAPGYYSTPDEFRPPKVLEWSFEVEQPLTARNVLAVTYSGNHGYDESVNNTLLNNFNANPSKFPAGFLGLPLAAPDPRFTTITQVLLSGYSNYDGLSVQLRHAFSYGFSGQLGYTWSHGLQYGYAVTTAAGGIYNPLNPGFGYTNSGLDNRHNFTADLLWQMPKLRNNLLDRVVGGWTLGVKAFAFSGRPFSVTNGQLGGQINANYSGTILADLVDPSALGKHCGSGAWNTPCLTQSQFLYTTTTACGALTNGCLTAQNDYGNVPPNSFYGPGYFDIDTQLTKRVRITERANFEFGASAYNTLNHPNFGQPSGTATSASLGKITSTQSPPVSIYGSGQGAFVSGRVLVVTGKFNF